MVTQSINLNLVPSGIEPRINVSQYDTGLSSLVCYMYEDTDAYNIPDGYTVMISGRTSVGTAFTITAAEVSGNKVVFPIKAVMTSDAGIDECEVSIINGKSGDDSEILGSANFQIVVEQAPLTKETVTRSDWDSIQQLANDVIDAQSGIDADKAESAAAMAAAKAWAVGPSSEVSAGTDTNNSKYWSEESHKSAESVKTSEINAAASEKSAFDSKTAAAMSEVNAKISETNAKTSAANAMTSETNAKTSETNSKSSEKVAHDWAVGPKGDGSDDLSAMHWALEAANSAGAVHPFIGATESSQGSQGLVPAPSTGTSNRYLCSDGTWKIVDVLPLTDDEILAIVNS